MKKLAIIKATFLVDTEVFQHVSQWEKAMMDFYAAHGADLEKMTVLGSDRELFYTVGTVDMISPIAQPKPSSAVKDMQQAKQQINPKLKKNPTPLVKINNDFRPKREFNPGKPQFGKVSKVGVSKFNDNRGPQGT